MQVKIGYYREPVTLIRWTLYLKRTWNQSQAETRRLTKLALRKGELLKRDSCEKCGETPTHCHHPDYSDHLKVEWLCTLCHSLEPKARNREDYLRLLQAAKVDYLNYEDWCKHGT